MNPQAPMWTADIAIDAEIARAAIAAQYAQFANAEVVPFGNGWDNAAFLVAGAWVFRFPRRRIAVRLIERECALLPLLSPRLPVPIPAPAWIGRPSTRYAAPFAGYALLAGATLASCIAASDGGALAGPLARVLRALHRVDPAPLVAAGLPPDEIGRLDHAKRMRLTRERALHLSATGIDVAPIVDWLESHPPVAVADAERAVVHGDLYARHVLVEGGVPSGIIDWGDMHLGDPAIDLAVAFHALPQRHHETFREAYGSVDDRAWHAARYRALTHAILEIDYGLRERDDEMVAIGRVTLAHAFPAS